MTKRTLKTYRKKNHDPHPSHYINCNSRYTIDLNVKGKSVTTKKATNKDTYTGKDLYNLGVAKHF